MNETKIERSRWPISRMLWLLACWIAYMLIIVGDYLCLQKNVFDWRMALAVLHILSALTFLLVLIALFRPTHG